MKETQDIARAEQRVSDARTELKALETELESEVAALSAVGAETVGIDTVEIKPKRGSVDVRLVSLAWKAH